ncbi:hypothetical protein BC361_23460 [Ensifer sp. LC54]|nr:hypothetical protein BC361_23460 [Ensifer sp. LC54]OCP25004.1 hypothetical protein BC363_21640 [Ensifer sp. LC384]
MRYMVLNTIRVLLSYSAMLTTVAWFFGRLDLTMALLFSSLYLFAFVPLPAVRLWKRLLYITLAAVVLMIVPFGYFVVVDGTDSVNLLLERIAIVVLFGLLGPQTFVFLLTYIALDLPVRKLAKAQIAAPAREGTI